MALLAEEKMILRDMLLELKDSCEQYGMKINANKTRTIVIARKMQEVNFRILNEAVERTDRIRNEDVLERVGEEGMMLKLIRKRKRNWFESMAEKNLPTEECSGRRLRWTGHIARMGESRNAYRVLVGRPEGKRPLGRPRRRWEDNIKLDLREVGYDDRDWINLAQNRNRWRAYVRAAMNLRLNIPNNAEAHSMTGRSLRSELRRRSCNNWCRLSQKGKGVVTYSEDPKNNSWISNRRGISSSERTNAIKMSTNVAAGRQVVPSKIKTVAIHDAAK
ncbi:hypothetical protein ANN_00802 [Periplaneta americana]|uniref:Endonuclease-reverse transcriptase n=1 Tax=Periplaneta americana TaxID=6978 RepID=A0ABQ8TU83_PERAM|nr:hypothetical protein ANN_00802 [Periplaneta americana]